MNSATHESMYRLYRSLSENKHSSSEDRSAHASRAAAIYCNLLREICHPSFVVHKLRWLRGLTHDGKQYVYKPSGETFPYDSTLLEVQQWALECASRKNIHCRSRSQSWVA